MDNNIWDGRHDVMTTMKNNDIAPIFIIKKMEKI